MRSLIVFTLILGLGPVSACGPGSLKNFCKDVCDRGGACEGNTQGQIVDCKTRCDNTTYKNCRNEDAMLSCGDACLDKPCNEISRCLDGCEQCVE